MAVLEKLELVKQIKSVAFLEGEFVTRAGKTTNYYIDKYLLETRPEVLGPVSKALAALFPDPSTYDRIAAPELGAVALAAAVSLVLNKPFLIVRKRSKEYGTQKGLEGQFVAGETVVVLEDVLTTAGAAIEAIGVLREAGLQVSQVIGVINREEGAEENLNNLGLPMQALVTKTDLFSV